MSATDLKPYNPQKYLSEKLKPGIPWYEKAFLKFYLGPKASKSTWDENQELFNIMSQKILNQIEGLSEEELTRQVLVAPLAGLEDNSRYWSIAMVLEHLVSVGEKMTIIIEDLSKKKKPMNTFHLSEYKPKGTLKGVQAVKEFEQFSSWAVPYLDDTIGNMESHTTMNHPWFGEFNCKQWFWLMATHQLIHYRQIKEIKRSLSYF